MIQIKIPGHLIIPFGCAKWKINEIRITGVSTRATYLGSGTPCVYIDARKQEPLRLESFTKTFPQKFPTIDDTREAWEYIKTHLKENCELHTESEKRFLDLYFDYCWNAVHGWWEEGSRSDWVFTALMPLPQAHLYLHEPLKDRFAFVPKNMVKVDFAFWTGKQLLAVEIDGKSHVGSERHIVKDRMLKKAGVDVIHILNSEVLEHGKNIISRLFPRPIVFFRADIKDKSTPGCNPLDSIPF